MQAIILAAGYGRRMQPLSNDCHNALLPVGGTTILGRIIDGLSEVDVSDIMVVTGYRADDVETFLLQAYPQTKFRFVRNDHFAETNNVVSLSLALEQLSFDEDVILVECDLLFDPSILERLIEHPSRNVALVDRYHTGMDGTVVTVANGIVTQVFPPHLQGKAFSYEDKFKTLNIYRFDRDFCRSTLRPLVDWYANQIDPNSYYELVLGMLTNIPAHEIAAEVVDGDRWVEVDDPNDLVIARFQFEPDRRSDVLDRNLGGHWNFELLDFAFMRNAYFPTDAMIAALRHALPALIASYGSSQDVLNEKLGYFLQCQPSRLQALNGASQAFPILQQMFRSEETAVPAPTFGEYARVFPTAVRYSDRPGIDWDEFNRLVNQVSALVVVNPNTPTGTILATGELYTLAKQHPQTNVIIDESFLPFSNQPSIVTLLEHEPLENVIVLASLSKALGAPGLRLGYVYSCNPRLLAAVGANLPIWNLSSPGEYLLELLIKFRHELNQTLKQTAVDRAALRRDLGRLPVVERVYPSGGNFLLVDLRGASGAAGAIRHELLAEHRIDVKDVTERFPNRAPRLRIAVRRPDENEQLIKALEGFAV
jgi:histidinol-phosphate/aromatic aminotransferase/cobyric acid decarboxylase-like protein/choline kinase